MRLRSVWTTNVTAAVLGFGMLSSILLLPQLAQIPVSAGFGFGASATVAGLYLVPQSLAIVIGAPLSAWLSGHFGSRVPLLAGISLGFAGFVQIILLHSQPWHIFVHGAVNGLAVGLSFAAMVNLVVAAVPQSHTGVATGMNMIMRSIGGAFQAQVAAAVLAATATVAGAPTETGFQIAFAISASLMLVALAVALMVPRPRRRAAPTRYRSDGVVA
jgi:MFS family permease